MQARPPTSLLTAEELGIRKPQPRLRDATALQPAAVQVLRHARLMKAIAAQDHGVINDVVADLASAIHVDAASRKIWDALPRPLPDAKQEVIANALDHMIAVGPLDPPLFRGWLNIAAVYREPVALLAISKMFTAQLGAQTLGLVVSPRSSSRKTNLY